MKKITTATLVAAGVLALPAAASAGVPFGSQLTHEPANGPQTCGLEETVVPCTIIGYRHPTPPNGDNVPSPAPYDGIVTKLRVRSATPDSVTFAFAHIAAQDKTATATLDALGPSVTLAGTGEIEEYPAHVAVKKGAQVALQGTSIGATYDSDGGVDSFEFAPPLTLGGGPNMSSDYNGGELLVQAIIEPAPAPRLTGVKLKGTKLRYKLSEAAKVTVRIRRGGHTVKRITRAAHEGSNTLKINRRALSSGHYRLAVSAKDADGMTSATKRISFRVKH